MNNILRILLIGSLFLGSQSLQSSPIDLKTKIGITAGSLSLLSLYSYKWLQHNAQLHEFEKKLQTITSEHLCKNKEFRFVTWRQNNWFGDGKTWETASDLLSAKRTVLQTLIADTKLTDRIYVYDSGNRVSFDFGAPHDLNELHKALCHEKSEFEILLKRLAPYSDIEARILRYANQPGTHRTIFDAEVKALFLNKNQAALAAIEHELCNQPQKDQVPSLIRKCGNYTTQVARWFACFPVIYKPGTWIIAPHYIRSSKLFWKFYSLYVRLEVLKSIVDAQIAHPDELQTEMYQPGMPEATPLTILGSPVTSASERLTGQQQGHSIISRIANRLGSYAQSFFSSRANDNKNELIALIPSSSMIPTVSENLQSDESSDNEAQKQKVQKLKTDLKNLIENLMHYSIQERGIGFFGLIELFQELLAYESLQENRESYQAIIKCIRAGSDYSEIFMKLNEIVKNW